MDYALLINDLGLYNNSLVLDTIHSLIGADAQLSKSLGAIMGIVSPQTRFSHLYYGAEFCEHRLPSVKSMRRFLDLCSYEELHPVFITPPVTNYGLGKVQKIIEEIGDGRAGLSIVANDYGLAAMIASQYPSISLIAGRVLDKTSHDSRASSASMAEYYGETAMRIAYTPAVSAENYRYAVADLGFTRFEFDLPQIGLDLDDYSGLASLYWPYSYLTTGRVCGTRGVKPGAPFATELSPCKRFCESDMVGLLRRCDKKHGIDEMTIYLNGNTLFYLSPCDSLSAERVTAFDRIVLQLP